MRELEDIEQPYLLKLKQRDRSSVSPSGNGAHDWADAGMARMQRQVDTDGLDVGTSCCRDVPRDQCQTGGTDAQFKARSRKGKRRNRPACNVTMTTKHPSVCGSESIANVRGSRLVSGTVSTSGATKSISRAGTFTTRNRHDEDVGGEDGAAEQRSVRSSGGARRRAYCLEGKRVFHECATHTRQSD